MAALPCPVWRDAIAPSLLPSPSAAVLGRLLSPLAAILGRPSPRPPFSVRRDFVAPSLLVPAANRAWLPHLVSATTFRS